MKESITKTFNNKTYEIYKNANFSIIVGRYCNAACLFCVEDLRNQSKKKRPLPQKLFMQNIDKALQPMRELNTSISLTGGEPTAYRNFVQLVKKIDSYNFRKKVVTTNGSYLCLNNYEKLDALIDAKFDHLNISKTHNDEQINRNLMQYKTGYFSDEHLQKVIKHIEERSSNLRIRLSCVLTKRSVSTVEQIKQYANNYLNYNIDNIVFRELMLTDNIIDPTRRNFYQTDFIDMTPILEEIKQDKQFKLINEVKGYYYNVLVFDYKGAQLCFEQADLRNMSKKKDNEIYEFVLHESGKLCGSWDDKTDYLIDITK